VEQQDNRYVMESRPKVEEIASEIAVGRCMEIEKV
jgi:hypothetical protein